MIRVLVADDEAMIRAGVRAILNTDPAVDVVAELPKDAREVEVEGRRLKVSNWSKVLWPKTGFTKGDLVAYYARIAPVLLPHLRDRTLTLKRYPNGVQALASVSLTIAPGMFGLLGPNGAGKSTLMRTLATLQEADSGSATLDDID